MAYRFYIFLSCFILSTTLFSQAKKLSPQAEISILTIAPGTSLNDAFGHSGFRVKDSKYGLDVVYNYGIYDFNTPNFYTKFAQGKLNYLIGKNYFTDFYNSYVRQNRTIEEQLLNINEAEKQKLFNYLETNYKPENRGYLYDFFFDNCATKIKDVTAKNLSNTITFNTPKELQPESFRTLIQNQLETNSWGSVGIDLALGSVIDKQATAEEHMFLPKYIHLFFNEATVANKPLVKKDFVLFKQREISSSTTFISSPFSNAAVDLLEQAGVEQYKIGSGEITNFLLLKKVVDTGKPIIISSGMSSFDELDKTVAFLKKHNANFSILQCTTSYPTKRSP